MADPIQKARHLGIRNRGARCLATAYATQPEQAHQSLDGAARHRAVFSVELAPDLPGPMGPHSGLPDAQHLRQQVGIARGSR